jgi:hypothetical protein
MNRLCMCIRVCVLLLNGPTQTADRRFRVLGLCRSDMNTIALVYVLSDLPSTP